ncbi:MAG: helix-turn-helix domain-containing protein, partial [Planctomycetota bacterium]
MKRATPIVLTDEQYNKELQWLNRGRRVSVRLAQRVSIVLLAADGLENKAIGERLGITRQTAGRWRDRCATRGLAGIEKDAPRGGRKRQVSAARREPVVRKTLHGTPEGQTHWSRSTMSAATGLSESTIGRIWKENGLKPHL